jgi:hypothetical protein
VTGSPTSVTFTFSEPLQTFTPSITAGGGTINAISFTAPSTTATVQLTPGPTPGLNSLSIYIRDNVDGGSDTLTYSFTARAPVLATIVAVEPASLAAGSATDVIVTFSEPIASVPLGGISLTGAGTLDTARFSFPYQGDNTKARIGVTSTSVTGVTFAGIVDVNEGATASPSASISTAEPPQAIAYGNAANYAYGSGLVTDTGSWTWQFWANLPTGAGYAIGGHFAGIEWHDAANNDWYLEPGPGGDNMGYKLTIGAANRITYNGTKRMTLVRSGTNFTLYSNGVNRGSISIPVYTFTGNYRTNVGIFNASSVYPVGGRTWDHSIWDTARTAAQIAANDLSGRLHHYSLNGTLDDSVGSLNLTGAGTPTYIAR